MYYYYLGTCIIIYNNKNIFDKNIWEMDNRPTTKIPTRLLTDRVDRPTTKIPTRQSIDNNIIYCNLISLYIYILVLKSVHNVYYWYIIVNNVYYKETGFFFN